MITKQVFYRKDEQGNSSTSTLKSDTSRDSLKIVNLQNHETLWLEIGNSNPFVLYKHDIPLLIQMLTSILKEVGSK